MLIDADISVFMTKFGIVITARLNYYKTSLPGRLARGRIHSCARHCLKGAALERHSVVSEKTSNRIGRSRGFERICQAVALLIGARCIFTGRNTPVLADGLAYLDVARAYARYDWHTAVNGYWSPLYAWILAISIRLLQPGVRTEFPMARALNFGIFATALFTFGWFWHTLADWSKRTSNGESGIPESDPRIWTTLGYSLFVASFTWHVDTVNPDILVAAIVFVIAACLFKLNTTHSDNIALYACLGLLLAIGYFAKTIMLYFAVFVLVAILLRGFRRKSVWKPVVSVLVFVLLIVPFVVILSRTLGHFTTGDSGKLNYSWFVNGTETKSWINDSSRSEPSPFYPGSIAFNAPRVFRLPLISGVTYAPWYDASRFDKRSHPNFNWRAQFGQLAINFRYLKEQILGTAAALTVPLLILVSYRPKESMRRFATTWFCTVPTAAVVGMYLLVHLVERFMLGFSLVLCGTAWASISLHSELQLLARRAMLAGIFIWAAYTVPGLIHYVVSQRTEMTRRDMTIAEAISSYGIGPSEAVASIGNGQDSYWAHLAKVSIVAEMWSVDSPRFWSEPPESQKAVLRAMADSGAKAVVWRRDSTQPCPTYWISLPEDSGCMILMP
jgi:hypothetical protein